MKILSKSLIVFFSFVYIVNSAFSQIDDKQVVSILSQIKEMPYIPELSGDSLFWVLAMEGLKIVPNLIDKIDDTTETDINVPNFGGFYTIGDISYVVLTYIIHELPIIQIIENKRDYPLVEDLNYWEFVRYSKENRNYLKTKLYYWFVENKENLVWIDDNQQYKTSSNWKYDTYYPTKGYYKLKDN